MSEALLVALISFAVKYGIPATIEFFKSRATNIDEAIAALERAQAKSIEEYIREDAAKRLVKVTGLPPVP